MVRHHPLQVGIAAAFIGAVPACDFLYGSGGFHGAAAYILIIWAVYDLVLFGSDGIMRTQVSTSSSHGDGRHVAMWTSFLRTPL